MFFIKFKILVVMKNITCTGFIASAFMKVEKSFSARKLLEKLVHSKVWEKLVHVPVDFVRLKGMFSSSEF